MSVVFDFNALLNDVAPVSPISFPVVNISNHDTDTLEHQTHKLFFSCLTSQIEVPTGNDVHHKSNTLSRAFSVNTPYRKNTNMFFPL